MQTGVVLGPGLAHGGSQGPGPVVGQHGPVELHHVEGQPAAGVLLPLHGPPGAHSTEQSIRMHPRRGGLQDQTHGQIHKEKHKREIHS